MPGIVRGAIPVGTMPFSISSSFVENHGVQININEYADGSTQRQALVNQGRRSWKIAKRLTATQLEELYQFFKTNAARAFYFYNPSETIPPFSQSPSGSAGRYIVRFASDWSQTNGLVRSDLNLEIIELAGDQDIATAAPVTNAAVPNSATLFITTAYTPNGAIFPLVGAGASLEGASTFFPFPDWFFSTSGWATRTNTRSLDQNVLPGGSLFVLLSLSNDSSPTASFTPADELRIYDCYAIVTYGDGSAFTWRPTAHSGAAILNGSVGGATNLDNAIDGNLSTFASLTCTQYGGTGLSGVFFSLSGFAPV